MQQHDLTQINDQYLSHKMQEYDSRVQISHKEIYFMSLKKEILFEGLIVMEGDYNQEIIVIYLLDIIEIIVTLLILMELQITKVRPQQVPVVERIPIFTRFIPMGSTIVFGIRDGVFHKEQPTQSRLKNGHLIEVEL